jgi:transposase
LTVLGKDVAVPKKFRPEFKRDVVAAARRGDLSFAEVAVDFDIAQESVRRWIK